MSQTVQLVEGVWTADIDLDGGWLVNLMRGDLAILYPKQELAAADGSVKVRGGCHVCVPNFGPGGPTTMPQHGYARTTPWTITAQEAGSVTLELATGPAPYQTLYLRLQYALQTDGMQMTLLLRNDGDMPLPVCPAFHPYFDTTGTTEFAIDGYAYDLTTLDPMQFLDDTPQQVHVAKRTIHLSADNLPQWVLWSDRLGEYVCLEPTTRGNGFVDDTAALLGPGQSMEVTCAIRTSS